MYKHKTIMSFIITISFYYYFSDNAAVAFMNQYWQPAFQALLPYAEEHGDQIMTNFVNEMFLRIPFNKLMPVE